MGTSIEEGSIERVLTALRRTAGLRATRVNGLIRLETASGQAHEVVLTWLPRIRESDTADLAEQSRSSALPRLFLTDALDKGALRSAPELGLQVADPGSAHIDLPGLFVHVEGGRKGRPRLADTTEARLLFALWRHGDGPVRVPDLERSAGVSFVHLRRHLANLVNEGGIEYEAVDPGKGTVRSMSTVLLDIRIVDRIGLLRRWERQYVNELRPHLLLGTAVQIGFPDFRAWVNWLPPVGPDVLVGGALGAARLSYDIQPDTATLHVTAWSAASLTACRVLPLDGGPVTMLSRIGDRDDDPSRPELAHPLLVLGELAASPDPRIRDLRSKVRARLEGGSSPSDDRASP